MTERLRTTKPGRTARSATARHPTVGPSPDHAEVSNQASQRLRGLSQAQTKLEVSTPGDAHEREADAIASRVMTMPTPAVPGPPLPVTPASAVSAKPVSDIREDEKKRQKEDDREKDGTVQRKAPAVGNAPNEPEEAVRAVRGEGQPLPASERAFFEPRLGRDLSNVRVQAGASAADSAASLGAQAYTVRDSIVFGGGKYVPGTESGRSLLAHELAHVVQQTPDRVPPLNGPGSVPAADTTRRPEEVARQAGTATTTAPPAAPVTAGVTASPTGPAEHARTPQTAVGEPTEEVALDGTPTFAPGGPVAEFLAARGGSGGPVHARFGNIASGVLNVREHGGAYETVGSARQALTLDHPGLSSLRAAGVDPVLVIRIQQSSISGFVSLRRGAHVLPNPTAITDWIRQHPAEMGWVGLGNLRVPAVVNRLDGGTLTLAVNDLGFRLGGFMNGTATVGLTNDTLTFDGSATVRVGGLSEVALQIQRDETGLLGGRVEVPVTIANFSGNILAIFSGGIVDITGRARYETEKLTGEVTLLVTDAQTARNVALQRLDPSQVVASAVEAAAPAAQGPRPGPRALAGYGVLDFAFTKWMTGQAQVIIDNEGHVTVVGEIAPPAEIELFPQRDYIRRIFTVEVRTLYGVPLVGNVFLFANLGLDAMAKLGPGKIYDISVQGTYSTDPQVLNAFSMAATLNISAFAGLRLRGEGGVGIEIADHDIKAGVGVNALAGVRGYVEATPTIGYRETADPEQGRQGEFYVNGHMELAAQPFLGLGGDLFVELDSPFWSPAPDKKWTWPLGSLEYPLPGEFGIGADVDYVLGSDELPEVEFTEVDFNAARFMTDLMNDHVPPGGRGELEKSGEWKEGAGEGGAPAAADPAIVDSQGAPPAGEAAQGQQHAGEVGDDVSDRPAGQPQPSVVKAAVLTDIEQRLRQSNIKSMAELRAVVDSVYKAHQAAGLRSLDVDVPDEQSMDIVVTARASAPERRTVRWADAFAPDHEDRALFEAAPRFETNAMVSVNGTSVGRAVASSAAGHAEQNLLAQSWGAVMDRVRSTPGQSQVVLAINRSPCHLKCTPALIESITSVPAELRERTTFILAPTGVYEPTENLTEEDLIMAAARYRAVADRLRAAGREVTDYTVVSRAVMTEHRTRMSDLHSLAAAGWDVRQLAVRPKETSAGVVLAEAAHQVAVRAGRVHAGSGG